MIKISFFYTAISLLFISKSYLQSVMDDYAEGGKFIFILYSFLNKNYFFNKNNAQKCSIMPNRMRDTQK